MKIFKYLIPIGLLAVVAVWFYIDQPKADIFDLKTEHELTSEALFIDYTQNEVEGNKKYLDKIIEVEGVISSIQKNEDGSVNITLESGDEMFGVSCKIGAERTEDLSNISEGDIVKIKGRCTGLLMDVVLVDCMIIS